MENKEVLTTFDFHILDFSNVCVFENGKRTARLVNDTKHPEKVEKPTAKPKFVRLLR